MTRLLVFMKRRAGLERPAFFRWWLDQHRPLAEKLPGLRRYVISHSAEAADGAFDGVAELWFDSQAALDAAFAGPEGQAARADREAYASRAERIVVVEHPFVDLGRQPRFKLFAALKRRADLDRPAFKRWWLERHAPQVVKFPELSRYQVSLVEQGPEGFADGTAEVCFDDFATLDRVIHSPLVKSVQEDSVVHTSAINRLLVEEHVIR